MSADELRAGRLRLEHLDGLCDRLTAARVAEPVEHERKAREDPTDRHGLELSTVELQRLLERLPRLLQSPLLLDRQRPPFQQ